MKHRKFSQQTEIIYYNKPQQPHNQSTTHKRSLQINTHKSVLRNSDSRNHLKVIQYIQKTQNTPPKHNNLKSSNKNTSTDKQRKHSINNNNNNNNNTNNNKRSSKVARNSQKIMRIFKKKQIKRSKNELLRKYFIDVDNKYIEELQDLKKEFEWIFSRLGQYPNNYRDFNHEKQQSVIPLRQRTRSVHVSVEKKKSLNYEDLFNLEKREKKDEQSRQLNIGDIKQQTVKRQRAQSIQISRVRRLSSDISGQIIEKTNKLQAYDNLNIIRLQLKEQFRQLDEEQKKKESNIQMQQLKKRDQNSRFYQNMPLIKVIDQGKKYNESGVFMYFIRNVSNMAVKQKCWFYKDLQSNIQGPFNSIDMDNWNMMKYFQSGLQISWIQTTSFVSLANFVQFPNVIVNTLQQYYDLTNIIQKKFLRSKQNTKKEHGSTSEQKISDKIIKQQIHGLVEDQQPQQTGVQIVDQIINQDLNEIKRQLGIIVENRC